MSERRTVRLETDGPVARVVLDDPDNGNVLTLAMAEQLRDAVREIAGMSGIRCVVVCAEGKRFCVGGDIGAFENAAVGDRINEVVALPLHEAIESLSTMDPIVVSVVQGAAGGGGCGLALAGDLVVASESAFLRLGYALIGLSPDCGVSWRFARALGPARAMELYISNDTFNAEQAYDAGLVSRLARPEHLDAAVSETVDKVLAKSPEALAATKRLMRQAGQRTLVDQLADEAKTIGDVGDLPNAREGFAAFLAKRRPEFR